MVENDLTATAESGAAPGATGGGQGDSAGPRRRRGPTEVQEVVDDLAQETKRTTLLDCLEKQVKDRFHISRIVFAFAVADDKKVQSIVEQEFKEWRDNLDRPTKLTGVLVFTVQGALHFLEGPTELLFGALQLFQGLAVDAQSPSASQSVISQLRVVHFTELHGVRTSTSWCSYLHTGKLQGGTQVTLEESQCADYVYKLYHKFLLMSIRAKEQAGITDMGQGGDEDEDEEVDGGVVNGHFKKLPLEMVPGVDEAYTVLSKNTADFFFSFSEFEKVFIAPFQMVLHSELLWPMSPALVY